MDRDPESKKLIQKKKDINKEDERK